MYDAENSLSGLATISCSFLAPLLLFAQVKAIVNEQVCEDEQQEPESRPAAKSMPNSGARLPRSAIELMMNGPRDGAHAFVKQHEVVLARVSVPTRVAGRTTVITNFVLRPLVEIARGAPNG